MFTRLLCRCSALLGGLFYSKVSLLAGQLPHVTVTESMLHVHVHRPPHPARNANSNDLSHPPQQRGLAWSGLLAERALRTPSYTTRPGAQGGSVELLSYA